MQQILDQISSTPGVLGACVCSSKQGILASNLPDSFKMQAQQKISSILQRIFKLNEVIKLDVNALEIQYDEALLVVKKICSNAALMIFCEPDANVHMLNMTTGVLADDLQEIISDCESPVKAEPAAPEAPRTPAEVLQGPLAAEMTAIKRALAQQIGPVAGKTLEKHLTDWLEQGAPERERLTELTQALAGEIDSTAGRKDFLSQVGS